MKKLLIACMFTFSLSICHTDSAELEEIYRSLDLELTEEIAPLHAEDNTIDGIDLNATKRPHKQREKAITFIVYIAADNDLRAFAANNIKQMASIGSSESLNIVVHLDITLHGNQKTTKRYFIEKNKLVHVNGDDPQSQKMDSGDPNTLISCCRWAAHSYPAKNYALVLWNHGTGIIDPQNSKIINPAELFTFNPVTNKFDLDRTTGFLDLLYYTDQDQRGICWDSTTGNYLTNKKLKTALETVCTTIIKKKFLMIGFDACLMSMLEVASLIKPYAEIMVGSQEVELGTGWNYAYVLNQIVQNSSDKATLSNHVVSAYTHAYEKITNDFTQSAIDLSFIHKAEENINNVATLLCTCLKTQKNNSVKQAIKAARNSKNCTHFDEPSYVDMHHLYSNLLQQIPNFKTSDDVAVAQLRNRIIEGIQIIEQSVLANIAGKNLAKAQGLSIYFPEHRIHSSYMITDFATNNAWSSFISLYTS